MIVPKRIMRGFKSIKDYGDQVKIQELSVEMEKPISEVTISKGLRSGVMSDDLFEVVSEYYKRKSEAQKAKFKEVSRQINDQN